MEDEEQTFETARIPLPGVDLTLWLAIVTSILLTLSLLAVVVLVA